jgi:hypothetical protein
MLHYPKIADSRHCPAGRCLAFEKYDGTNLHWDWDRDFGWHAFGTRRDQFNLLPDGVEQFARAHEHLREAPGLFVATLADGVERVFRDKPAFGHFNNLKVFTEFLGPNSFAGLHKAADPKRLVLFDVWAEGFGIIGPRQFLDDFGHLSVARLVFDGKFTPQFSADVREGKYGVTEGVVCKWGTGGPDLRMAKIKTYAYLERLKQAFADRWEDYWE